jgi:CBS domain-containing protein
MGWPTRPDYGTLQVRGPAAVRKVHAVKISDILRHKGAAVVTIAPTETVTALLAALAAHNVGALVVLDGDRVVGVVSERDVVRRLAEHGPSLLDAAVAQIMTTDVFACSSKDSVDSIAATMTERRVRHMPVIDDDTMVGIVSIGDVVLSRIRQLETDRGQLEQYIVG